MKRLKLGYLEANDYNFELTLKSANLDIMFNIGYFIGYCKVMIFGYTFS